MGLTTVAFGTSMPELVVNLVATLNGYSDIVFGNIIGSNNFNLFIILGLTGLILPLTVQSSTAWRELPISLLITGLLILLLNDFTFSGTGHSSRLDGMVILILFLAFLFYIFIQLKSETGDLDSVKTHSTNFKIWSSIILGITGLVLGGQLVVSNSITLAQSLGVSEKIIGLTIVAAGTSLPELVTSIVAVLKKNSDMAIGNVIGSNIFNILLILSICSIVNPIEYNPRFNTDLYILFGGTLFLLTSMVTGKRKKLDRWEAAILFGFYIVHTIYLISMER